MTTLAQDIKDAKTVAQAKGWRGGHGGWIYDSHNIPICQGWTALADKLYVTRIIGQLTASGERVIDWQHMHQTAIWRNR